MKMSMTGLTRYPDPGDILELPLQEHSWSKASYDNCKYRSCWVVVSLTLPPPWCLSTDPYRLYRVQALEMTLCELPSKVAT